jgi:hypothetical protein
MSLGSYRPQIVRFRLHVKSPRLSSSGFKLTHYPISGSPCRELLDDAARDGAFGVVAGTAIVMAAGAVIMRRVGLRRAWPYLTIVLDLFAAGGFV